MLTDNEAVADPEDHAGEGEGGSWGRAPTWGELGVKLCMQNHPSLQGCFSGMPLLPAPIYG